MDNHEALLKAFRIKPEDIEANRAGRLGPTQAHNLLVSGNFNLAGAFLVGLVLAAILYWLANKPLVPIQWILSLILFAITLFFGVRYFRQTREAVQMGALSVLLAKCMLAVTGARVGILQLPANLSSCRCSHGTSNKTRNIVFTSRLARTMLWQWNWLLMRTSVNHLARLDADKNGHANA